MTNFTPVSALLGGLLIGLASSLLLWLNGRIAGVSGVLGGVLALRPNELLWRVLFLLGLVIGCSGYLAVTGTTPLPRHGFPVPLLLLSGLLVGFGSARANGCTSGHGVCGLARWSLRSLVATLVFLSVSMGTTFVLRHVVGLA